jgi:hypothetical protein
MLDTDRCRTPHQYKVLVLHRFISCVIFRYVAERSPNWLKTLKEYFDSTPSAAVGEVFLFYRHNVGDVLYICLYYSPIYYILLVLLKFKFLSNYVFTIECTVCVSNYVQRTVQIIHKELHYTQI